MKTMTGTNICLKAVSLVLTIGMLLNLFSICGIGTVTASADAVTFLDSGIMYQIKDSNRVEVTKNNSNRYSGKIDIPKTVTHSGSSYDVTSIGEQAFSKCTDLTGITIPDSVTSIGDQAFRGCTKLKAFAVEAGNKYFKNIDDVLYDISGTTLLAYPNAKGSSYAIPSGVTSIGADAFRDCVDLTGVTIPTSVTSIGYEAFCFCTNLTGVTIPSSVTSIKEAAFYGCSALTDVTIPSGVTSIDFEAFTYCTKLKAIAVEAGNKYFKSIDGVLYNISGTTLWAYPTAKGSSYAIPTGVTSIGDAAFRGCANLTGVTIPSSVTSIGIYAFAECAGLTDITIPSGVTFIGEEAFCECTGLTGVTIPSGVTSIADNMFEGCTGLTSVTIPASVTSIGDDAFAECTGLTGVTIPASVTSIGEAAFCECRGLTNIVIPAGVTSIGDTAFCDAPLTDVTIPASVTSIGDYAFYGCRSLGAVYFDSETQPASIGGNAFWTIHPSGTKAYYRRGSTYAITSCTGIARDTYSVSVASPVANGRVTPSTANGIPGETISLNIEPDSCYSLKTLRCTDSGKQNIAVTDNYYFTMPDSPVTVSATFEKTIFTVTFDRNDGTGASPARATTAKGGTAALPAKPERTGYTFAGWNTKADGSGTEFTASTTVTDDITVYAKWNINPPTPTPTPAPSKSHHSSGTPSLPSSITDPASGIQIDLSGVTLPSWVTKVTFSASQAAHNGANDSKAASFFHIVITQANLNVIGVPYIYNIQLLDQNGNPITGFIGKIKVKVPIPSDIIGTPHIFHYEENTGALTDMNAVMENGLLIFETDHFGYYAIAGTGDSITLDTKSYQMPVDGSYQIGVKLTGGKASFVAVTSTNDKIAAAAKLKNGNVQVTGKGVGTAYIMFDVYDSKNKLLTHASVRIDGKTGIRPRGDSTRQTGLF